jgi:hypothetical protein
MTRCRHFNGIQHDECLAGVAYRDVRDATARPYHCLPCLGKGGCATVCELRSPLTPEELAEEERGMLEAVRRVGLAREAILVATAGEVRTTGETACPICSGTLKYSVASNGHIFAACVTERCVQWME